MITARALSLPLLAFTAVFASSAQAQLPAAAGPFVDAGVEEGVKLETQPLTGTKFPNLRATVDVEAPPALVLELMFGKGERDEKSPSVTSSEVLLNEPARRVYYETAAAPLVDTREYVLEVRKELDPARERYALRFQTISWPTRPESSERVRITIVGNSVVTPLDGGARCRVVQHLYTDPGGNIPAWAAAGPQRKNVVENLKRLKKKAEAAAKKG